jgi:hypothetical protein
MITNEGIIEAYVKRCDGEITEAEYQQFMKGISAYEVEQNLGEAFFDPRLVAAAERSGRGEKVRRIQEILLEERHYANNCREQ